MILAFVICYGPDFSVSEHVASVILLSSPSEWNIRVISCLHRVPKPVCWYPIVNRKCSIWLHLALVHRIQFPLMSLCPGTYIRVIWNVSLTHKDNLECLVISSKIPSTPGQISKWWRHSIGIRWPLNCELWYEYPCKLLSYTVYIDRLSDGSNFRL